MARRHGRNGRLYLGIATSAANPSSVAFLKQWSAEFAVDTAEVTSFGDTNKVYVSGRPDAQGSFSGYFDDATAQSYTAAIDGDSRKFYLYPDITNSPNVYWYGTGFFDFSIDAPVDGAITISGSWRAASTIAKNG
jgi:hypothetical protein